MGPWTSTSPPSSSSSRLRCQQAFLTWASLLLTHLKCLTLTSTQSILTILYLSSSISPSMTLSSRTLPLLRHILPIYGDGPMYLELYGVTLHAKAAVLVNADGFVEITEMDIAADFTDIAVHLDNLVGGGNFGETINNILNLLGPMIWDLVKGYLFPFLDEILLKVLNDALAGCNIADLVQNGSCFQERLAEVLKIQSDVPFPLFKGSVYH